MVAAGAGSDRAVRPRIAGPAVLAVACATLATGCGAPVHARPAQPRGADISTLWWWMLAVAAIVFVGAIGLLVLAWLRRRREGLPLFGQRERPNLGLVRRRSASRIPLVVLVALFVVGELRRAAADRGARGRHARG